MKKNKKFLFREKNIKFIDFIRMYFLILNTGKFHTKNIFYKNHNIEEIIKEELEQEINSFQKIEALTTYFAFKNISNKTYISKSINWFENQITDKLWNFSLNKYHKNCKTIGYKGTVPSQLLFSQSYALNSENIYKMLPQQVCLIGDGFTKESKRFCNEIDFKVIIALRYAYLNKIKKYNYKKNKVSIFLALPAYDSNQRILNLLDFAFNKLNINIKVYYKTHPINNSVPLNVSKNFHKCENIDEALNNSEIIITGMSSLSLEAIALGKFVINIENPCTFNFSTIPKEIPNVFWKNAYDGEDLLEILKHYYINRKKENQIRESKKNNIMKEYFNFFNKIETLKVFKHE